MHLTKILFRQVLRWAWQVQISSGSHFFFSELVVSHFNFENNFLLSKKRFHYFSKMTVNIVTFHCFLRACDTWLMNWMNLTTVSVNKPNDFLSFFKNRLGRFFSLANHALARRCTVMTLGKRSSSNCSSSNHDHRIRGECWITLQR